MLKKIQEFLKTTRNKCVEATAIKHGVLQTEVTLRVISFADISRIEKSLQGLSFYVQCPNHILIPKPETGEYRLIIPNASIENVKFSLSQFARPTHIFIGMDEQGDDVRLDIARITHAIIAGATGSGKSMVIHAIIHSLLSSGLVKVIFLDPKRVESQMYMGKASDDPDTMVIASDPTDISNGLADIQRVMEDRYKYMAEHNIRDAMDSWLRSNYSDYNLRPIVLVVDEVADLFNDNKEAKSKMLSLSSKARAAGIKIFLATQRPDAKIIDGAIKANFTTRICLKTSSAIDSTIVLGFPGAEHLSGNGHGLLLMPSGTLVPFKGALLDNITLGRYSIPNKQATVVDREIISADIKSYFNVINKFNS